MILQNFLKFRNFHDWLNFGAQSEAGRDLKGLSPPPYHAVSLKSNEKWGRNGKGVKGLHSVRLQTWRPNGENETSGTNFTVLNLPLSIHQWYQCDPTDNCEEFDFEPLFSGRFLYATVAVSVGDAPKMYETDSHREYPIPDYRCKNFSFKFKLKLIKHD